MHGPVTQTLGDSDGQINGRDFDDIKSVQYVLYHLGSYIQMRS